MSKSGFLAEYGTIPHAICTFCGEGYYDLPSWFKITPPVFCDEICEREYIDLEMPEEHDTESESPEDA